MESKKIGIVTFFNSDNNYGAVLQCYALQMFLRIKGYDPYVVKYIHTFWNISNILKLFNFRLMFNYFTNKIKRSNNPQEKNPIVQSEQNHLRRFDEFRTKYFTFSERQYSSSFDLKIHPPKAYAYICGSDQIWNAPNDYISPIYFLGFGGSKVKRIAYAASMGKDRPITPPANKLFIKYLSRLNAVFLRESDVCELCKKNGRPDAEVVLDPSLLLEKEDYVRIMDPIQFRENYLFSYLLNIKSETEISFDKVRDYSKENNLRIVKCTANGCVVPSDIPNSLLTIPQWLSAIYYADSYITTSFHGLCFAIIFEKRFLVYLLGGEMSYGNQRILTLLENVGLTDRIYNPNIAFKSQMEQDINWVIVKQKLNKLRERSIGLLLNALNS